MTSNTVGKRINKLRVMELSNRNQDQFILGRSKTGLETDLDFGRLSTGFQRQFFPSRRFSRYGFPRLPKLIDPPTEKIFERIVPCFEPMDKSLHREETLADLDYMMPSRVREVLQSEGLHPVSIDTAIGQAEQKYKKNIYRLAEESRRNRSPGSKSPRKTKMAGNSRTLPKQTTVGYDKEIVNDLQQRRGKREGRSKPWTEKQFSENQDRAEEEQSCTFNFGKELQDSINNVQTEIERTKWLAEQHTEKLFAGLRFTPPRIVLLSSKIHKGHLLSRVFKDESVLSITYDFETWTFADILDSISERLEKHRRGCKAKSIMIYCQGGPGFVYLVRNIAITPQKLSKPSYKGVVEFWKMLSGFVSKINPAEAAIHIFGSRLTDSEQGIKLVQLLQTYMLPNIVQLSAPHEDSEEGRTVAAMYFNYNRYKIWQTHQNTSVTQIDYQAEEENDDDDSDDDDPVRTWTSLAGDCPDD